MTAVSKPKLLKEEQYLIDKYGDNILALMAYGSMVFGIPRKGSIRDYWIIYKDYEKFHNANKYYYRDELSKKSNTVEKQIELNKEGPNFYSFDEPDNDIRIKIAVAQIDDFIRFCEGPAISVKGRMQKPLKVIFSDPAVEEAIKGARREGALDGVNLVKPVFHFDDFLFEVVSLSYRADLRIESTTKKINSIIDKGKKQLLEIYRPLLDEIDFISENEEGLFVDTRDPAEKKRARKTTLRKLRKLKYSWQSIAYLLHNYKTFKHPHAYVWAKLKGEVTKVFKGLFIIPFFRKSAVRGMIKGYQNEISASLNCEGEALSVEKIEKSGKGGYRVTFDICGEDKELTFLPLKKYESKEEPIAKDSYFKLVVIK